MLILHFLLIYSKPQFSTNISINDKITGYYFSAQTKYMTHKLTDDEKSSFPTPYIPAKYDS